eukprot:4309646-Pleurochrysis_carterae.AAC.2
MARSLLGAAASFGNLRTLNPSNPFSSLRKLQIQFDNMGWTRGHDCTRLILRTPDLLTDLNSPVYSRDVMFYIGSDKIKNLIANFAVGGEVSIRTVLKQAMRFSPISDLLVPEEFRFRCTSRMHLPSFKDASGALLCAECDVAISAGGNLAVGHAGFALDSPVARYGCCLYCWLPKKEWFDVDMCKADTRRNLVLETALAHLNPFQLYEGALGLPTPPLPPTWPAPGCATVLSAKLFEKEQKEMEAMSVQMLAVHLRNHRKLHYGKEKHCEMPVLYDHAERAPSLRHHRINTCSSAIAVTLANRATPAAKKKMNEIIRSYGQKWAFAEKKGLRDTRASSNESRALLTSRALLRELLCIRYNHEPNEPDGTDALLDEMSNAQDAIRNIEPEPDAAPQTGSRKRKAQRTL